MTVAGSIRRGTAWMLVGQVALSASNWLQFLVVARTTSVAATGRFALAVAIATPLALAAAMNLRVVQVCDVRGEFSFRDYLGLRVMTSALSVAAAPLVVILFFDASLLPPTLALTAVRGVEALSDIVHGRLQVEERWRRIAASMFTRGVLGFAAFAAALRLTGRIDAGLYALLAACAAVFVALDLPVAREERAAPEAAQGARSPNLRGLARTALPLALASVVASLVDALPKYVLEHVAGPEAVALFTAPLQLVLVGAVLVNTYAQGTTRHLALAFAEPLPGRFRRLAAALTLPPAAAGALLVLVAWTLGTPLLVRIFGPAYRGGASIFVVAALGGTLSYVAAIVAGAVVATGRFRQALAANLLVLVVVVAAAWLLIPAHGAAGAAWTFVVASAALSGLPALVAFRGRTPPAAP